MNLALIPTNFAIRLYLIAALGNYIKDPVADGGIFALVAHANIFYAKYLNMPAHCLFLKLATISRRHAAHFTLRFVALYNTVR